MKSRVEYGAIFSTTANTNWSRKTRKSAENRRFLLSCACSRSGPSMNLWVTIGFFFVPRFSLFETVRYCLTLIHAQVYRFSRLWQCDCCIFDDNGVFYIQVWLQRDDEKLQKIIKTLGIKFTPRDDRSKDGRVKCQVTNHLVFYIILWAR